MQHYRGMMFNSDLQQQQIRDEERVLECKMKGITLIEIPYWWNSDNGGSKLLFFTNYRLIQM